MKEEAILNLWYAADLLGYIYELRAKVYITRGTDQQMMRYLRARASGDYSKAWRFPLPSSLETTLVSSQGETTIPAIRIEVLPFVGGFLGLFREAYATLATQSELRDRNLTLDEQTLICVTPLLADGTGELTPQTNNPQYF